MALLILETAFDTPFPIQRFLSPSRSSIASFSPVEAPDGTAARPLAPLSSVTSASTVGFPRESMICLPVISLIALMVASPASLHYVAMTLASTFLSTQLLLEQVVYFPRIRLPSACLHHLPDEETQYLLLPFFELRHLRRILGKHFIDDFFQCGFIGDLCQPFFLHK